MTDATKAEVERTQRLVDAAACNLAYCQTIRIKAELENMLSDGMGEQSPDLKLKRLELKAHYNYYCQRCYAAGLTPNKIGITITIEV